MESLRRPPPAWNLTTGSDHAEQSSRETKEGAPIVVRCLWPDLSFTGEQNEGDA